VVSRFLRLLIRVSSRTPIIWVKLFPPPPEVYQGFSKEKMVPEKSLSIDEIGCLLFLGSSNPG